MDSRVAAHRVVGGKNRAPRVAEDEIHAFALEALPDDLGAAEDPGVPFRAHPDPVGLVDRHWFTPQSSRNTAPVLALLARRA